MVEFGAGGNIVHAEDATTEDAAGDTAAVAAPSTTGATATIDTTPTPAPALGAMPTFNATGPQAGRRKRRAKGWFCPVCRQRKSTNS